MSWSYDNAYQLTKEHRTGTSTYENLFSYDAAGDRLVKNEDGARTTSTYDAANQLQTSLNATGTTTYSYDADGNQHLVQTPAGNRTTTIWDYENRTTLVELPSGIRNTMSYEPDGLRTKLEESTSTRKFIWDHQSYLAEADGNNDLQVVFNNTPARYGNLISQRRGSTTSYYHYEAPGSTRELSDSTEAITDTYLYDAWGNQVSTTGTTINPFRWTGKVGYYWNEDAENYYIRARTYSPVIGRWLSTDPLGFVDGLNLYFAYFVPNKIDPSGIGIESTRGLDWCEICLYEKILRFILPNGTRNFTEILLNTKIVEGVEITDVPPTLPIDIADLSLEEIITLLTFLNPHTDAITLGSEIHFKNRINSCEPIKEPPCCKSDLRQAQAGIDKVNAFALVGHELVHVNQVINMGKENFYRSYLLEWNDWLQRGANRVNAYLCISYEIEGKSMQETLGAFFKDENRKEVFEEACCKDKSIPEEHVTIIKEGYNRRVREKKTICNRKYPR